MRQLANTNSQDTTTGVSWSKDGQRLAFSAFRGTDPDIYVVRASGGGLKQLTFSRGVDVDPSWAPDNRHIAFETNRNGQVDIYSMDDKGRDVKRLTSAPEDEQDPSWSPDGTRIAYTTQSKDGTTRQIWVMNGDGSGKKQLTNEANFSENPNWSPDGKRIAFDSDRAENGDLELYSMNADGSGVVRLTDNPALDALPAYSPDGKQIVFVSDRTEKDSRRLFLMPAAGGPAKRVLPPSASAFQMVPDWQPLRTGVAEKAAVPPGAPLSARGASDRVDPLYDPSDAWSVRMDEGVTYRINATTRKGCVVVSLYGPGTRSFGSRGRDVHPCGGYFTFTPGPGLSGLYSVLVAAQGGTEAVVAYHLEAAAAGPDDEGPGVPLADGVKTTGSVSARGVDMVDVYRFDLAAKSRVAVDLASQANLRLELRTVTGETLAETSAGAPLRKTLGPQTYLLVVSATQGAAGAYALTQHARVVTKTVLKADGRASATVGPGRSVTLAAVTTPDPSGGEVRLRADYRDALAGWVYRKTWTVPAGSSVLFMPTAVGDWRVRAVFLGTRASSPSASTPVLVHVRSG